MRSNKIDEALYGRKYSSLVDCGCKSAKTDTSISGTFHSKPICHPEKTSVYIQYEYEGQIHSLVGDDLSSFLTWTKDNIGSSLGKVFFNISCLAKVKFTSRGKDTVDVFLNDGRKLVFSDLRVFGGELTIHIKGDSGRSIHYRYVDRSGSAPNLLEILGKGEVEVDFGDSAFAIPWAIVYGVVVIIAGAIDLYCDNQVAQQVAACTAKGQCSVVNTCGATCVSCGA